MDVEHEEDRADSVLDRGREEQPLDEEEVEESAEVVEQLQRHGRSFDDAAGVNPDRGQHAVRHPDDPPAPPPGERRGSSRPRQGG